MGDTTRPDDKFSMRDSFAAAALTGLVTKMVSGVEDAIARQAYIMADAMIQVRKTMEAPPPTGEVPPVEEVPPPTEETDLPTRRKK